MRLELSFVQANWHRLKALKHTIQWHEGGQAHTLKWRPDVGDAGVGHCLWKVVVAAVGRDVRWECILANSRVCLLAGIEASSCDVSMYEQGRQLLWKTPGRREELLEFFPISPAPMSRLHCQSLALVATALQSLQNECARGMDANDSPGRIHRI